MDSDTSPRPQKRLDRWGSGAIVLTAIILGLIVLHDTSNRPRTDDAEIFANFIGIAPQVEGPIIRLNVRDNQYVKQGQLLFEIDPRPYQYALEKAVSDQATLEGQISDYRRTIAAQVSGVSVAQANILSSKADVVRWAAAIDQAKADVTDAEQGVRRAQAEWAYANDNLHRVEPLLARQFVTSDQVDKARSEEIALAEALNQAQSQLLLSQAQLKSTQAQYEHSVAVLRQSRSQHQQSIHSVLTLEPLGNQRGAREAAVRTARYNLNNCWVYAPFDARINALTISQGAYAHVGQQIFTLIDARTWWAVGNFREGQLRHIWPGMRADVYVLTRPNERFAGVVESLGFGVTPDADIIGNWLAQPGNLPDIQRTLNWVHLASRYPVRVRVQNPPPELFRVGESAVVIIRGR
jgi:membrane fusion protein, multidrug efflux system